MQRRWDIVRIVRAVLVVAGWVVGCVAWMHLCVKAVDAVVLVEIAVAGTCFFIVTVLEEITRKTEGKR